MCSEVYMRIGPDTRTESGKSVLAIACSKGMRVRELAIASCKTSGVARADAALLIAMASRTAGRTHCATRGAFFFATSCIQSTSMAEKSAKAGSISIPYRVLYQECGHQSGINIGTEP